MANLAKNLAPMFLGGGSGGINGILGNITGVFGNLISGVGNTISSLGGNPNNNQSNQVMQKTSNKKMYYMIGAVSFVIVLGTVVII